MIRKSIILKLSAGVLVLGAVLGIYPELFLNKHYITERNEEAREEKEEVEGYLKWKQNQQINIHTGKIEAEDVYKARKEAAELAKKYSKTRALNLSWEEKGPNDVGGRTRSLLFDKNSNDIYAASVGGGLWKSPNHGSTWIKKNGNDSASAIAVSCLAQGADGTIYYGTGEGIVDVYSYNVTPNQLGEGVYKSTDGGVTFTQIPATAPNNSNLQSDKWALTTKIVTHPTNPNLFFVGTHFGLQRTTDGGGTFVRPGGMTGSVTNRIMDIEMSNDGNTVYVATNNGIYISTDGGQNFGSNINTTAIGLPGTTSINRIDLAISPSQNNVLYAVFNKSTSGGNTSEGCYKSVDGGATWTTIAKGGTNYWNPLGFQGYYDIAMAVHPTNPDILFLGGQFELLRYNSSNNSWVRIAYWSNFGSTYVHADMHGIFFNPNDPEEMFVVCDGGIFRTDNSSAFYPTFQEKNANYNTIQCYGVGANILGHVIFGAQDNGTNLINGTILNSPQASIREAGGDGTRARMSDYFPNVMYASIIQGVLLQATDGGQGMSSWNGIFDANVDSDDDGAPDDDADWVAPIEFYETTVPGVGYRNTLLLGTYKNIWMTQSSIGTGVATWFPILRTSGNVDFTAITMSADGKVVYAGTAAGLVYRITGLNLYDTTYVYDDSTNLYDIAKPNNNFTQGAAFTVDVIWNGSASRRITDLATNANGSRLIITVPNYGASAYIYISKNALAASPTVSSIQGNLPAMPVYSCAFLSGSNDERVILGTELGVYGTENAGSSSPTWVDLNINDPANPSTWHPRVLTYEVTVKPFLSNSNGSGYAGDVVYTGTHGRGVFMSKSLTQFWPTNVKDFNTERMETKIYPNPVASDFTVEFDAENTSSIALQLVDLKGKIVLTQYADIHKGTNKVNVNIQDKPAGLYLLKMNTPNGSVVERIIKK